MLPKARTDGAAQGNNVYGALRHVTTSPEPRGDAGSAARFFYSAKATKADRAGSKHPTVKPVALMQYLIRHITPPGGTVLDPFAGSGTTLMAAKELERHWLGIEINSAYLPIINGRLSQDVLPLFLGGGGAEHGGEKGESKNGACSPTNSDHAQKCQNIPPREQKPTK